MDDQLAEASEIPPQYSLFTILYKESETDDLNRPRNLFEAMEIVTSKFFPSLIKLTEYVVILIIYD